MLCEETVISFVKKLASGEPAPGGGSAAALGVAIGAGLIAMGLQIAGTKVKLPDWEANLQLLNDIFDKALLLVEEDFRAYLGVVEARRLPKGTSEEKKFRKKSIADALFRAAQVPEETAKLGIQELQIGTKTAPLVRLSCLTDVMTGIRFLRAGVESALDNVRVNLESLRDMKLEAEENRKLLEGLSNNEMEMCQNLRAILKEYEVALGAEERFCDKR